MLREVGFSIVDFYGLRVLLDLVSERSAFTGPSSGDFIQQMLC